MEPDYADHLKQLYAWIISTRLETGKIPVEAFDELGFRFFVDKSETEKLYLHEPNVALLEVNFENQNFGIHIHEEHVTALSDLALEVVKSIDPEAKFDIRTEASMGNQGELHAGDTVMTFTVKNENLPLKERADGPNLPGTMLYNLFSKQDPLDFRR